MRHLQRALALASLSLLAACATTPAPAPVEPPPQVIPAPAPPPKPTPPPLLPNPIAPNARLTGVTLVNPPANINQAQAARALAAFRISCPAVQRRRDTSELATGADWAAVCAEARTLPDAYAASFFYHRFDWVQVGTGTAFATGYYEPELRGSRVRAPGYETPIYRTPADLIRCSGPARTGRGRINHEGQCELYYTRGDIEDGALQAWLGL